MRTLGSGREGVESMYVMQASIVVLKMYIQGYLVFGSARCCVFSLAREAKQREIEAAPRDVNNTGSRRGIIGTLYRRLGKSVAMAWMEQSWHDHDLHPLHVHSPSFVSTCKYTTAAIFTSLYKPPFTIFYKSYKPPIFKSNRRQTVEFLTLICMVTAWSAKISLTQ